MNQKWQKTANCYWFENVIVLCPWWNFRDVYWTDSFCTNLRLRIDFFHIDKETKHLYFIVLNTEPIVCILNNKSIWHISYFLSDDVTLKYPFFYRPTFDILEDGWQAFQPETELARYKECSEEWRISTANKEYKVSVYLNFKLFFLLA